MRLNSKHRTILIVSANPARFIVYYDLYNMNLIYREIKRYYKIKNLYLYDRTHIYVYIYSL